MLMNKKIHSSMSKPSLDSDDDPYAETIVNSLKGAKKQKIASLNFVEVKIANKDPNIIDLDISVTISCSFYIN